MNIIDPFAEWDSHDPATCEACKMHGTVERPVLETLREQLKVMPPDPGWAWRDPATLDTFNQYEMNPAQLNRFMRKVEPTQLDWHTPCWLWTAGTHDKGYGRFQLGTINGKRTIFYTHRLAFEHWIGPPPVGLIVDHQCNHKLCCNPTHLWPETNDNNIRLADARRPWKRRNQFSKE